MKARIRWDAWVHLGTHLWFRSPLYAKETP